MAMFNPPHPGEMIGCIIEEMSLTVTDAAKALGVSRQTLSELVNEGRSVSPEMALRIEAVFGGTADSWLRDQAAYDLAQVRSRATEITAGLQRFQSATI